MNFTINLFLNQNQKGQVFYLVRTVAKFVDLRTDKEYLLMLKQKMSANADTSIFKKTLLLRFFKYFSGQLVSHLKGKNSGLL